MMQRPTTMLLESAYDTLFQSQSFDTLIDAALDGRLFSNHQRDDDVAGRSMVWKLFLLPRPPLTASLKPHATPPLDALRSSREHYVSLLKEKMRAPDGSYEKGLQIPGSSVPSPPAPKKPDNLNLNNPLSLDSSNPWHAYFSAIEVRNTIRQDVERTFPDIPYFRDPSVQDEMTNILYIYSRERDSVGYRQGMHELLACIYRVVDYDSVEAGNCASKPDLEAFCNRTYVVADAYTLFSHVMQKIELWYDWRPSKPSEPFPRNIPHFTADGELVPVAPGQMKPYVTPIIPISASIRDDKLAVVDPHLFEKLREGNVEPQMYIMRWLRLLFTREFSLAESMILWDGLFASIATDLPSSSTSTGYSGLDLALWICIAMLIRIRNILIPGDYTAQLTNLLRYPTLSAMGSSKTWNNPELLLRQAQLLMASPTPATGVSLMMQNRNELNIPVEVPETVIRRPSPRRPSNAATLPRPTTKAAHVQEKPGIQEVIANRIMDANETYGIQRGLLSTISELRKNLPEFPHTLMRNASWNSSSISLSEEGHSPGRNVPAAPQLEVTERPPWEPRTRSEIEAEVAELRGLLKKLSSAVGWAVDVLLLDNEESEQKGRPLKERKQEAIECMAYVRDVLAQGGNCEIDEERLVSAEEYRWRKQQNVTNESSVLKMPEPVVHSPTLSNTRMDNHVKSPISPLRKDSFTPLSSLPRTVHGSAPLSPDVISHFSSQSLSPIAQSKAAVADALPSRRIIPPWQHTPSNFSGDSPYTRAVLPKPPPPSSSGPVSIKLSSHTSEVSSHDSNSDPLGVMR